MTCYHHYYDIEVDPHAYEDTNVRRFALRVRCRHCKQQGRFLGVAEGVSLSRPCMSADGFTVLLPAVMGFDDPEYERRLAS